MKLSKNYLLNHRYKILSLIGEGGYSYVYKASDVVSGNKIYTVKQTFLPSDKFTRQYQNQISLFKKLKHPHLPVITDSFFDKDFSYVVFDYIDGKDLRKYIQEYGVPSLSFSLRVILQVANVVNYLHTSHSIPILHRDIKPANIIIDENQTPYLVDFGLTKIDKGQETDTIAQAITPGYSPVEQYGQEKTDVRADIYSLGATFFYLLTGIEPQESIARVLKDSIPKTITAISIIPQNLVNITVKAMAINPEDRYETVSLLISDLEQEKKISLTDTLLKSETQNQSSLENNFCNLNLVLSQNIIDNGQCEIVLDWQESSRISLTYRLVRKYFVSPKNLVDGDYWDIMKPPFVDSDVENGKIVYYGLFVINSGEEGKLVNITSGMRMDDVYDLEGYREAEKVKIKFRLPRNIKNLVIRKSYTQMPSNIFDGSEVASLLIRDKDIDNFELVDDEVADTNIFYTIFCRYAKSRSLFMTSKGRSILI